MSFKDKTIRLLSIYDTLDCCVNIFVTIMTKYVRKDMRIDEGIRPLSLLVKKQQNIVYATQALYTRCLTVPRYKKHLIGGAYIGCYPAPLLRDF